MQIDIQQLRNMFPSLKEDIQGNRPIYFDGPAGTQVPAMVIEAVSDYYKKDNANTHGQFASSQRTDRMMERCRNKIAQFLNSPSAKCISLGQNMTTLNFSLARALARNLKPGDEIIITQLDHEANRGPWLSLREQGIVIKEIPIHPDATLDYSALPVLITNRTKIIACGLASNFCGTVNNIDLLQSFCKENDALLVLDAVHYAPHLPIDVQQLNCDFLLCSAYKFYGPHIGILYSRPGLLDQINTDRLKTQDQSAPYKIETGTLNHAAIAGVEAALNFIVSFTNPEMENPYQSAMEIIRRHEFKLAKKMYDGLISYPSVKIYGPDFSDTMRAPTLAISVKNWHPQQICQTLASHHIHAWDGHFYAIRVTEKLGLLAKGGVCRIGMCCYNSEAEVLKTLNIFKENIV